jgi:hypothetical protein
MIYEFFLKLTLPYRKSVYRTANFGKGDHYTVEIAAGWTKAR